MPDCRLYLLGAPHLECDRQVVFINRRKTLALLSYLALTAQGHTRETLAALFWPEYDQSSSLANLRRDLSRLRRDLGEDLLLTDRQAVSLNPQANFHTDVGDFQQLLSRCRSHDHADGQLCPECAAGLQRAVTTFKGKFMEGFSLSDCPLFDEWQFFQAETLNQALVEVLQRLIDWHIRQQAFEPATELARRWLAQDKYHEPAHRALMRLYAWSDRQAAALRQYKECQRILMDELGVEPEEETIELFETIKLRRLPGPHEQQHISPAAGANTPAEAIQLEQSRRYVQGELLTIGGHGVIYRGRDLLTGKEVIIKRLKRELVRRNDGLVERFLREAQALRQLNHPNIVAYLDSYEQEGLQYIVMEHVTDGSLRDRLEAMGQLPLEDILRISLELADALSRAHYLGIVHRDVKPENILLAADGSARLSDFGMARLLRDNMRITQPGMVLGSPAYMSPEALRGEPLGPAVDVWSMGVVIYEMLTGQLPFSGGEYTSVMFSILQDSPPELTLFRTDAPSELVELIGRMLEKDPARRIGSMRQVAAGLEFIRDRYVPAPFLVPRQTPASQLIVSPVSGVEQASLLPAVISPSSAIPQTQSIHFCLTPQGDQIAYASIGSGPPLVKAANWLSHLEYDWHSPIWRHWLAALSHNHTLIRYDERGCGLSDWNVTDYSFEAWIQDLECVVDAAGLERFALLGVSQGGPIAIAYAVRHPEKVSHLVLYGSYARGTWHRNITQQQREEEEMLIDLIRLGWGKENPAFRQVFTSLFLPQGTAEQLHAFNELQRISSSPENAVRIVQSFREIDVRHLAPKVTAPTLVLHADQDGRIPFKEGRLLASLIPGAHFVPLEGKNHILLEHEPAWMRFVSEVQNFLDRPR